ncbi:MAG TPA: 2-succinyl-5-enolpyruvyl-6-hydroxy-3-cyclohexene-1-carboxylic-acid synthase [Opitutaceae bacterium]|nr:2-succinyl-5-enolpyruvyl-6-hydroxy-3-cyclohexene-1-carboxylic-acid synthase [Opitutaceae bacterium]
MSLPPLDSRNVNSLWCSVLAATLHRCGVAQAVICPGSRSTPLAFAFAAHPGIEAVPVLDERSASFFALGLARRSRRPVALVCTSGTAAANFLPAVIEAQESGAPLLVLTADRPPEMRACASGQTIDQQKLYGGHVNFHHELAVPKLSEKFLCYLRQTLVHAVERTLRDGAGPVHLNAPFRDPLPPVPDGGAAGKLAAAIDWERFFAQLEPVDPALGGGENPPRLPAGARGVIVAGPEQQAAPEDFARTVAALARKLGWPVLADTLSPLRHHAALGAHLVTAYDLILRSGSAAERLRPEAVLCLGGWPTSKVLRRWVLEADAPVWLATARPDNRDALHARTRHCRIPLAQLAAGMPPGSGPDEYRRLWAEAERTARAALDDRMEAMTELFEGRAAWLLGRHLPAGTPVFVANSMPARDVEFYWPPGDRAHELFCNRGANGIDGTLSTALGVAHGGPPAVLLTGDLALLHDTNGFLIRPKFRGSLTIVLINNRGGGIFGHLPVSEFDPPFEEFVATPQEADFARLAAAYGVEHVQVRDWKHFTDLIAALPAAGIRVLELATDRKRDVGIRERIFREVADQLG